MPVDPTEPSKIREPVYGCKNPSRSASSITLQVKGQWKAGLCRRQTEHTSECDTVLHTAPGVEVLHKGEFLEAILRHMSIFQRTVRTSALPRISTPNASLSELIRTSGVFPGSPGQPVRRRTRANCSTTRTNQPRHAVQYLVTPQLDGA